MNAKQFLDSFFSHSRDAMLLLDAELSALRGNTVFHQLTGHEENSVSGKSFDTLFSTIHNETDHGTIHNSLKNDHIWQGKVGTFNITILPLSQIDKFPVDCLAILSPLSRDDDASECANSTAVDMLTGLPEPAIFLDRVDQALHSRRRENNSVALLLVDLDRFGLINAGLGRENGDLALQEIAERIQSSLRESDSTSRITGDKFCILIKVTADDHSALVAEKILLAISQPLTVAGRQLMVTASIGISTTANEDDTAALLIEQCENALRHAKNLGGNCFHFFADNLNKIAKKRLDLEHNLLHAIEHEEFTLFYQPKVDVKSLAIVGAEALIRWQHPQQGMIPPSQFIPVAEETGQITHIGSWVLYEACRQNKQWQDEGLGKIAVAVNVSPRQFQLESFADIVHGAVNHSGLAPQYLELEITESMLMDNIDHIINKLKGLEHIGLTMAIDDFGTGYSNLSYLTRFPVSTLKIDQAFVREVNNNKNIAALTRSIISMSHNLNMKVVAEGAETKEHVDFLRRNKCDIIQGYYYSKPLPAWEFAELLRTGIREGQ